MSSHTEHNRLLIAHRGGLKYNPENTCQAFEFCRQSEIDWIEIDVRFSRDGIPVCVHDDRINFGDGKILAVKDCTLNELHQFDAGNGNQIPALNEVFERLADDLRFDIELKELEGTEKVIDLVNHQLDPGRFFFTSFIPDVIKIIKQANPEIRCGLLVDRFAGKLAGCKNSVNAATSLRCEIFLPNFHRLNKHWIDKAHDKGLEVIPWTVNRVAEVKRLVKLGVDGIITDCPLDVREYL